MKRSILLVSIIMALPVLITMGCTKDIPDEPGLLPEKPGDGFVQATIDGKTIVIKEAADPLKGTVTGEIHGANNNNLSIGAHADIINANSRQIYFALSDPYPLKEGTYNVVFKDVLGVPNNGYTDQLLVNTQWKNENGKLLTYISSLTYEKPYPNAKVTITKFTNKKGEYIEGTFSVEKGMTGENVYNRVSLTDGKFKAQLK